MDDKTNSEFLSNGPTRRQAIFGIAVAFGGLYHWPRLRLVRKATRSFLTSRNPFTRRSFSRRTGSASTRR